MPDNHKVLITTSGIGSRLGDFTKYTNKSLLRIGDKPAISYIIDAYPADTKFVVTLGYYGDQVKDFLEIAYPKTAFEFVKVDKFQGEGSSLLFSLSHAKSVLQCPFIFHASDTIVLDKIPAPDKNWNAGFKGSGSSNYASFDILDDKVTVMYDKGNLNPDYLHIGLVGIHDYERFWNLVDVTLTENNYASTLGDVDVLKKMVLSHNFHFFEVSSWFDIGNVDKMNEAKKCLDKSNIHVLDKLGESIFKVDNHIIKFFFDTQVCKNRVLRSGHLKGIVPDVVDSKSNFYKYRYADGKLFSSSANKSNFIQLLDWADKNLWKKNGSTTSKSFKEICQDFYFTKTRKRLNELYKTRGIFDTQEVINDVEVPTVESLLGKIDIDWFCNIEPTRFHGDFILDNIIYKDFEQFTLIDWRQDFGGELALGDMYYDLSKLAHNLVVNHEMIDNNHFMVKQRGTSISINIHRYQTLVECEQILFSWLEEKGYDSKKVKLLRAIIWLNMSPLHHHPFDIFLYYQGKYHLYDVLRNEK